MDQVKKTIRYGLLIGCLLLVGCSELVLDRVIIYPAYSFNREQVWRINTFNFEPAAISGLKYDQVGDVGQRLTDQVRDRLTKLGIKISDVSSENEKVDYILKGEVVSVSMSNYEKGSRQRKSRRKDRWGRAEFETASSNISKISVNGRIIQVSTNKMMAGFELYESTFMEGSPGVEVLLLEISNKIVDIVLGKRT